MGVLLTPIVVKETIDLAHLRGKRLAVDGNGELYQFLALIRQRDGTPLHDAQGRITSHLSGLFYRTTHLIARYGIRPVFVFDGTLRRERVGDLPTELVPHFFRSLCEGAGLNLHLQVRGDNDHHQIEACFKCVGRALRQALERTGTSLPSTKGAL